MLPALEYGPQACLRCPSKPVHAPLDWQPHPGFGMLTLTRNGETPDEWYAFADEIVERDQWCVIRRGETVTLAEIEQAVAQDPDHDWRLRVDSALYDATYQRQGPGRWVLVEKGQGFA